MRFRFSLRTMLLAVFGIAALLALFKPVARISPAACARIVPGMTEEQAINIVGVPPGWYDGVGGVSSNAPHEKGDNGLSWVGMRGEIVVDLDESRHVSEATFYPVRIIGWSPTDYLWERFTRVKYIGLGVTSRIILFVVFTAVATTVLGLSLIDAAAKNAAASHGLIGLAVGAILAVAVFSSEFIAQDFTWDPVVTLLALSSALVSGALVGVLVGLLRGWLPRWPSRNTEGIVITNPAAIA